MNGIIVNLAPTGLIATRSINANIPLTVTEIVEDVRQCVRLGANLVHLHAREEDGSPSSSKDIYARLIGEIRSLYPDLVICVSLSGRIFTEFERRISPLLLDDDLKPDMGSLTLSSMNFSSAVSINEPEMIKRLAGFMLDADIKPELEVFDTGMVNYAAYLLRKGFLKPPLYFNVILGNVATGQARLGTMDAIVNALPAGSIWTGGGFGEQQLPMNVLGILFGDGIRTGLEDNFWLDGNRRHLARNADLVARAIEMAGLLGREAAKPSEVRKTLKLKPRS